MIRAFVGRGGSGKTFAAVRYLYSLWRQGRAIYSTTPLTDLRVKYTDLYGWIPVNALTFGLDWADGYLTKIEEIYSLDNCEVFLDEVGTWLPAKGYKDVPDDFFKFLAQDRREGVNVTMTHRTFGGILKELRDNTSEVSLSSRFGPLILQTVFDPDTKSDRVMRLLTISPRIYDLYQTLARVGFRDGSGYGLGQRSGYQFKDSGGRTLIRIDNWGQHCISIYVRPEQMICLKRKFGAFTMGFDREERVVAEGTYSTKEKYKLSHVRWVQTACRWQGHITETILREKRGIV